MAYTDGKRDYSDAEVEDAPMWNAGSVYFDDEIVEYQSRYYIALSKTSAEVPGRGKKGKWKELVYEEGEVSFDDEACETFNELDDAILSESQDKPKLTPVASQKSLGSVNKPLAKKQTLKERQEQKRKLDKEIPSAKTAPAQAIERKMTMAPSDQSVVNEVLKEMEFKKIKGFNSGDDNIKTKLILPQTAKDGIKLIWESSHPDIISSHGVVTRPEDGQDVAVNLSLRVSKGETSATRFFTLWVKALEKTYSDDECVAMVYDRLNFDQFKGKNLHADAIMDDLELLTHGLYDTQIVWASTNRDLLDETGKLYQNRLSKNTDIRLYAIIIKGETERLKHFDLRLKLK